jgi:hypothetical protein
MKIVNAARKIEILQLEGVKESARKHGPLFPNSIRGLIIAPSGGGKTTVLISMLLSPNGLKFANLFIYSKSLHQPKYKYLEKIISGVEDIGYHTFSNNEEIIEPENTPVHSIMVFDDIAMENQDIVKDFFSRGRHSGVDSFYLCQSYSQVPKHLVRDNVNFLIIFKQDHFNLLNIYKAHVNSDTSFEEFIEMCRKCWERDFGFLLINKDEKFNKGRYKMGFDAIIIPDGVKHGERESRV